MAVRHVVLSSGTAIFHGIPEFMTKEQAMMLHTTLSLSTRTRFLLGSPGALWLHTLKG